MTIKGIENKVVLYTTNDLRNPLKERYGVRDVISLLEVSLKHFILYHFSNSTSLQDFHETCVISNLVKNCN